MERRYPVLQLSVKVMRVLAWVALGAGAIGVLVGIVGAAMGQTAMGQTAFLTVILVSLIYGLLIFWVLMMQAEGLRMAIDIEENTRGTRSAVEALRAERAEPPASDA
ncbi:hypothetical protein FJZ36_14015 [Candidatus Poribacteria bacterium]|nr:hypothetical protein [Candidatus Poribacteria bacterium]